MTPIANVSFWFLIHAALSILTGLPGYAAERVKAPAFPEGLSWLNVTRPLTMEELNGRVIILDFWTYGCINCIHVVEELRKLEKKYGDDLVVIGVHSPKFTNEGRLQTLRRILIRYRRTHPIIQDNHLQMMKLYHVRAWPTLMLIDITGKIVGYLAGEKNVEVLTQYIDKLLSESDQKITLSRLPIKPEAEKVLDEPLAAPGKIAVTDDHVIVSDTLHNRLVIMSKAGKIIQTVGSGDNGFVDGDFHTARFSSPQGVTEKDGILYLADTGNHSIRQIDLKQQKVTTLAGNGAIGYNLLPTTNAREASLRSPWDLIINGNSLYIAMAGSHQIWRLFLNDGSLLPYAGSGAEGLDDGDLLAASFSQPSGLFFLDDKLFVADSEASAIRRIDLEKKEVTTLLGKGLFIFGDQDGSIETARIQHPLSVVAVDAHTLLICDTYNHKIKRLDLQKRSVVTLIGNGSPGSAVIADKSTLDEPGGMAIKNNMLWIADTNNDRILRYDLATRGVVDIIPLPVSPPE